MEYTYDISFIGAGNMGGALLERVCAGMEDPGRVCIHRRNSALGEEQAQRLGCAWSATGAEAVKGARYVMLCVKPQNLFAVLDGLLPAMWAAAAAGRRQTLVSIAAGVTLDRLEGELTPSELDLPVIRLMPNTPCAVGKGVILVAPGKNADEETLSGLKRLLAPCGRLLDVSESQLDMGCAISGCGPAFAYLFLEALADGGVEIGLPRSLAQTLAAQTLLGAADLALQSGQHPGALKDAVCSPGGATIAGVSVLESHAFRAAVMSAVVASYEKGKAL